MGESPAPSPKLGGFQAPTQPQIQPQPQLQVGSGRYYHHNHQQQQAKLSLPNMSAPDTSPMKSVSSLESTGETEYLDLGDGVNNVSGPENDDDEGEDEEDDMDDVEDEEDDDDEEAEDDPSSGGSIGDAGGYSTRAAQPSVRPLVPVNGRNMAKGRAAAEDFPLPPGFGSGHVPVGQTQIQAQQLQAQQAQTLQMHHASYAQAQTQARAAEQSSTQQPPPSSSQQQRSTRDLEISPPFSQVQGGSETHSSPYLSNPSSSSSTSLMASSLSQSQSLMATTATSSPAFRALPLLATDLPYTRICVSQSSIRPNDRGKEVLSFTVEVDPGHGKELWKVEKLYSDVLGLDQRIRASVGKGVGKKIGNLPEGKLWRDHAPAKVDQRKVNVFLYHCVVSKTGLSSIN
jgi:RalA-binding protein 1